MAAKLARRWVRIGAVLAVAVPLILLGLFWVDLTLAGLSWSAEREFVRSHSSGAQLTVIKAPVDWAIEFGGRRGLPRLTRLSQDDSLTPAGRALALEIADSIRRDDHLKYAEESLEMSGWWRKMLLRRILERDRRTR